MKHALIYILLWTILPLAALAQSRNDKAYTIGDIRGMYQKEEIKVLLNGASAGISDFAKAFAKKYPNGMTNLLLQQMKTPNALLHDKAVEEFKLDRANGYIGMTCASDGDMRMEICYWKKKGSRKNLVVVNMINTHEDENPLVIFYDFSPETTTMKPIKAPVEKLDNVNRLHVMLPRIGKNIIVYEGNTLTSQLKWNGEGFVQADFDYLGTFIDFPDSDTDIRNAPNGTIIHRLKKDDIYIFSVCDAENGWWKIFNNEIEVVDGDNITPHKAGQYWVHYSHLGTMTRNYNSETLHLYESPSKKSKVVYSFKEELLLRPLEIRGDWAKVETPDRKHCGWILAEWLCGNPLTNCS